MFKRVFCCLALFGTTHDSVLVGCTHFTNIRISRSY